MTLPAVSVAAAYHGVRAAMPLDMLPYGRNPFVIGTSANSPRLPHARFLPPLIFQQQNARSYMPRGFASPNNPPGRAHTAWRPYGFSRNVKTSFPSFPEFLHICVLLDLLKLLLLPLLLSRSAHGHAVRPKIPLPLRTASVPTIILPSWGFSCCYTSQLP